MPTWRFQNEVPMSAAMFAKMKEMDARLKALEQEVEQLKAQRPVLKLPEKGKAA